MFTPVQDDQGQWTVQQDLDGHSYVMPGSRYKTREHAQMMASFLEAVRSGAPKDEIDRRRGEINKALGRSD